MRKTLPYQWLRVRSKHFCARTFLFLLLFPVAYLATGNTAPGNANPLSASNLPAKTHGQNLNQCLTKLNAQSAGWCEIYRNKQHPSISSVWPKNLDKKTAMITGPKSILIAWNSAAFDRENKLLYFWGGGHADYGGNEVYRFDLEAGTWRQLTTPSPLTHLFVQIDYDKRPDKPWRRLCWTPDINKLPASSHTYDGLIFSHTTKTLFVYIMAAANGSCLEDNKDRYRNHSLIVGARHNTRGWYEFNPSSTQSANNLEALGWRRVFDSQQLATMQIQQGYPVSTELGNGKIVFGSKHRTIIYDPANPDSSTLSAFSRQADWGDGIQQYDAQRELVWSLHSKMLLAFDAKTGKPVKKIEARINHGKSIAINNNGTILSWNGRSVISFINPDQPAAKWQQIDWGTEGPTVGDGRVYGKWVYLTQHDVFVGLSSHQSGVWVYKHGTLK